MGLLQLFLVFLVLAGETVFTQYYDSFDSKSELTSNMKSCELATVPGGRFVRLSPSSKYFFYKRDSSEEEDSYTAQESRDICFKSAELEQAEVTKAIDLRVLEKHLQGNFWIGLNHKGRSGKFIQGNDVPIQFQVFTGREPDNVEDAERCVLLVPNKDTGFAAMEDASCDSVKAGALCQFRRGSSCFLQSAEETSTPLQEAPLASLAEGSRFYISTVQKNYYVAFATCLQNGLQLVTLDENDVNQELSHQIKNKLAENRLHPATQFWTGGIFQRSEDEKSTRLVWLLDEDVILPATQLVPHQWARASENVFEPFDQSQSGFENCLDISFENTLLASAGTYGPYWRAGNCYIPKYYICERVSYGVSRKKLYSAMDERIRGLDTGDDGLGDDTEFTSCNDVIVDTANYTIDIEKPQQAEDIIQFMLYSFDHDLRSGNLPFNISDEFQWKAEVISLLVKITQNSVSQDYVDHGMLNVVRAVLILYLTSPNLTDFQSHISNETVEMWNKTFIPHLRKCEQESKILEFGTTGYEINNVVPKKDAKATKIEVPEEAADKIKNLDAAIDILWYMFSFAAGLCYDAGDSTTDKTRFFSDMLVLFISDFLHDLRKRWVMNVELAENRYHQGLDYSLALGDADFKLSFRNLRFVVTAGYMKNNISHLQPVRPLDMTKINTDKPAKPWKNVKTGFQFQTPESSLQI